MHGRGTWGRFLGDGSLLELGTAGTVPVHCRKVGECWPREEVRTKMLKDEQALAQAQRRGGASSEGNTVSQKLEEGGNC